jgi:hypothetical protein
LRTIPARISQEWILRPQFHVWPPSRHRTVLWVLAHMVCFRLRERRAPSVRDYSDFLRRTRWKVKWEAERWEKLGNYLAILWARPAEGEEADKWDSNPRQGIFCGLVVSMLTSGTQDHRFKPGRSRRIFRAKKNPQHAFLRRGNRDVCRMSQLCGMLKNPTMTWKSYLLG